MTIDEFIMLRYLNAVAVSGRNAMGNTTQSDLDYNRYLLEVLGITVEECESINTAAREREEMAASSDAMRQVAADN